MSFLRVHRRWVVIGAFAALSLLVFVLIWFQPHKLLIEETVAEAVPTAAPPSDSEPAAADGGDTAEARPEPRTLAEGEFRPLEHATNGTASVLELADGSRFLRLEDLDTSNGPDLRVYLSEIPASDDWYAYGERFVDLGALKGNRGDQNYRLPDDLDLSRFKSAVIWCRRFTVGFAVAPLRF